MKLLKLVRKKSFISDTLHILLNIGLAVAILATVQFTESLGLAIFIVLISKWRVFAVRPRFWIAHLQSNLVDYIVNLSLVVLMYAAHTSNASLIERNIIVGLGFIAYLAWLLYLKPKSKRFFMSLQAGAAVFLGVTAVFTYSYDWWASPVVLLMWVIGYGTARHILSSYEESNVSLIAFFWGLTFAELGWIIYHWTIAYAPFGFITLNFPRAALSLFCISFIAHKAYDSYYHHKNVRWNDIMMPVVFTFCVVVLLPLILSLLGPNVGIGL
jgi:hypothetical protein